MFLAPGVADLAIHPDWAADFLEGEQRRGQEVIDDTGQDWTKQFLDAQNDAGEWQLAVIFCLFYIVLYVLCGFLFSLLDSVAVKF